MSGPKALLGSFQGSFQGTAGLFQDILANANFFDCIKRPVCSPGLERSPFPGKVSHGTQPSKHERVPAQSTQEAHRKVHGEASQGRGCSRAQQEVGAPALPTVQVPEAGGGGTTVCILYRGQHLDGLGSRLRHESEKPLCSSHSMVTGRWFPDPQRGTTTSLSR